MIAPGRLESNETNSRAVAPAGGAACGGTPMQLRSPPCALSQLVQPTPGLIHSATHSQTFPAMSYAPHREMRLLRAPVSAAKSELVAHVAVRSSFTPGSGVPAAAACHSSFLSRRLPESRQACSAWNQVTHVLGGTPATDAA